MPLLVAGAGAENLTAGLAKALSAGTSQVEFKTFPDGEQYVRILAPLKGEDVIVVQTGYPPERMWKLLLLLEAAAENGADRVRCVVPYLPYARQDRRFLDGEPVSARLVARAISQNATECITVEPHKADVAAFFTVPCHLVSAADAFAAEFKTRGVDVVLAPDAGARDRAEAVARRIGAQVDHLEKRRISSEVVEVKPKSLSVGGKTVAILDDIISTGGTMVKATEQLVRHGAKQVICAGIHGLFIGGAVEKLRGAGAHEVLVTDTIDSAWSRVSMASSIAEALGRPRVPAR